MFFRPDEETKKKTKIEKKVKVGGKKKNGKKKMEWVIETADAKSDPG